MPDTVRQVNYFETCCKRAKGTLFDTAQPRADQHAFGEHEHRGDGAVHSGGGSTTAIDFEAYVEQALCPSLKRGQVVVVMDNLSAHKGQRIRELIEGRGCELIYLPPYYAPDFNPIEEAFSKIKGILRRIEARTREVLVGALGEAISAVTARDARGFFEHCGYSTLVQSL